jgi:hypothetical protein
LANFAPSGAYHVSQPHNEKKIERFVAFNPSRILPYSANAAAWSVGLWH